MYLRLNATWWRAPDTCGACNESRLKKVACKVTRAASRHRLIQRRKQGNRLRLLTHTFACGTPCSTSYASSPLFGISSRIIGPAVAS